MGKLDNVRYETFAKLTATGKKRADCWRGAGYKSKTDTGAANSAKRLSKKPEVAARIAELEQELVTASLEATGLSREYVINELTENVEMAKAAKPILNSQGKPTGEFKADLAAANSALVSLGKELGMFRDRLDIHNLDSELDGMTGLELRNFVRSAATEVGLRVVEMNDDDLRAFIIRNAERVGLRVTEGGGEDSDSAEDQEVGAVQAVPKTDGVPPTRH